MSNSQVAIIFVPGIRPKPPPDQHVELDDFDLFGSSDADEDDGDHSMDDEFDLF